MRNRDGFMLVSEFEQELTYLTRRIGDLEAQVESQKPLPVVRAFETFVVIAFVALFSVTLGWVMNLKDRVAELEWTARESNGKPVTCDVDVEPVNNR